MPPGPAGMGRVDINIQDTEWCIFMYVYIANEWQTEYQNHNEVWYYVQQILSVKIEKKEGKIMGS